MSTTVATEITYDPNSAAAHAEELLLAYWSRDLAACPLPVNPFYLADRLGVQVIVSSLEGDVAGALFKERGQDPVIFINRSDGEQRRRFTLGHELGHLVARTRQSAVAASPDDWGYIDLRSTLSREGRDPAEMYANNFAASLLMPATRVVGAWESGLCSAPELASLFDVSLMSMEIRVNTLRKRSLLPE